MLAFYIDEKLTSAEETEAVSVLNSQGHKLECLEYKRIPCVFPVESAVGTNEKMLENLRGHVRNAGVPAGTQSILIIPKDGIRWAIILQEAFYLDTGFYPIIIQQWQRSFEDGEALVRRDYLNMIDMHSVMTDSEEN